MCRATPRNAAQRRATPRNTAQRRATPRNAAQSDSVRYHIEMCNRRSRINFVKKFYEVKCFLILLIFSEDVAYNIKMIF